MNNKYNVNIENEDNFGNGVTRIDNLVTFVPNTLKDENVDIEIINKSKKFQTGKVVKFNTKSNRRCNIKCDVFNECGGCSFLHINFLEEKEKKLNEINKLFNTNIKEIVTSNEYNYRNKATFHVKNNKIGYYSERTNDIVEFNHCMLLDERINFIYDCFKNIDLNKINEVVVRVTDIEIMVIVNGNIKDFDYKIINNQIEITSFYLNDKLIYGKAYIVDNFNNLKYSIYPESFYQVNKENMKIIYDKVKEYAHNGNKLLDLYCGTGTIGLYLSDNFKDVLGIEINKQAILNANINKKLNNISNINFICGNADIVKNNVYDVIVVDPPRSGLSSKVINFLNNSNANRIVYVSCNYKTLKRDIDLLSNYCLKNIECINMFNKTKHVECVCLLNSR